MSQLNTQDTYAGNFIPTIGHYIAILSGDAPAMGWLRSDVCIANMIL